MQRINSNIRNVLKYKALKVLINKNRHNSFNLFCMSNKFYASTTSKIS